MPNPMSVKKELSIKEMERIFNLFERRVMKLEDEADALKRALISKAEKKELERLRLQIKKSN